MLLAVHNTSSLGCAALTAHMRVPVGVEDDHGVGAGQVDAQAARARGQQEHAVLGRRRVERVDARLALRASCTHGAHGLQTLSQRNSASLTWDDSACTLGSQHQGFKPFAYISCANSRSTRRRCMAWCDPGVLRIEQHFPANQPTRPTTTAAMHNAELACFAMAVQQRCGCASPEMCEGAGARTDIAINALEAVAALPQVVLQDVQHLVRKHAPECSVCSAKCTSSTWSSP